MQKVNLERLFSEHWSPKVVGELNGQQVKLAKLLGTFDWHHHEGEDELFLVLYGTLTMRLGDVVLEEGGALHRPARSRAPASLAVGCGRRAGRVGMTPWRCDGADPRSVFFPWTEEG